jgi:hypothetical protein
VCTVSAVHSRDADALRIVINRDERRLRMLARPPEVFTPYGVPAIWPVDQQAGGTWTAINAHGLAFALLNASGSLAAAGADELVTRGAIIPYLAAADDIDDAMRRFVSGPARWPCRPFRLLVASFDRLVELTPVGSREHEAPLVLSTSSLGDHLVEAPRRALFDGLRRASDDPWRAQDRFHQHAWPDRRHVSVLMSRPDACTVSRTAIVITRERSELQYAALCDGWPAGITGGPLQIAHRRASAAA